MLMLLLLLLRRRLFMLLRVLRGGSSESPRGANSSAPMTWCDNAQILLAQ